MALTREQNARIREVARTLLADRYGGNVSGLARALKASQSLISRFLTEKTGTSLAVAERLAALAGIEATALLGMRQVAGARAGKAAAPTRFGDLPGWAELEKRVQASPRAGHLDEEAWEAARETMVWRAPTYLDELAVIQLVELWQGILKNETPRKPAPRMTG